MATAEILTNVNQISTDYVAIVIKQKYTNNHCIYIKGKKKWRQIVHTPDWSWLNLAFTRAAKT